MTKDEVNKLYDDYHENWCNTPDFPFHESWAYICGLWDRVMEADKADPFDGGRYNELYRMGWEDGEDACS